MTTLSGIGFSCPSCRSSLDKGVDHYFCPFCHDVYKIHDSIPIFTPQDRYYGEVGKDVMLSILEDANRDGYQHALRKHILDPFVYKYVADEKRAKWMEILPLGNDTLFLDMGCGWGTNSIPIARVAAGVVALDFLYERVKFVQLRAEQSAIKNVVPVVASALRLPFPSDCFDIVAFNGVLEWLGGIDKSVNPRIFQVEALREAHRVLKPGGTVYIGIENRYSLRYFLGDPDDHSFLRFTSLMPRWVANLYCRIRTGNTYYTHTHSLGVYLGMLSEAGFMNTRCYFPWPDYRNPDSIVPLERKEILTLLATVGSKLQPGRKWLFIKLLYLLTSFLGKGYLCHSFCFTSQKNKRSL